MDEVTYVVELLKQNWAAAAIAAGLSGHQTTPTIIDIRNMTKNKGRRYYSKRSEASLEIWEAKGYDPLA